jgi:putative addiction module component (TIGR02574 family)
MSNRPIKIDQLSPTEKLGLLEDLWDSLARTPEVIPLTAAQREELDRRLDDLEREGPVGIPWEQVLDRIQGRIE